MRRGVEQVLAELASMPFCYWKVPGNAGDSVIHLGSLHAFRHAGCRWDRIDESDDVEGRTVVVGGGGNLTPLYDHTARAITSFRERGARRIVLLPHGVRGPQPALEPLTADDLVLGRDPVAVRHARSSAPAATVRLEHDMAVHLRVADVMSDVRQVEHARAMVDERLERHGLTLDDIAARRVVRFTRIDAERRPGTPDTDVDISHHLIVGERDDDVALEAAGLLLCVAAARAIETDRLHVAFAAAMLGVPCTLFPNSYDKNKAVHAHTLSRSWSVEFQP